MTVELVKDYLDREGYRPQIDDDGDIMFKAQGLNFLYFANQSDQNFFQLALPGIMDVTPENRELVLEVCNAVSFEIKVAKATILNRQNSVWIFFENLLQHDPEIADILPRAINICIGALQTFRDKLK